MKESVLRVASRLMGLIPARVRSVLVGLALPVATYVAAAEYRRKYDRRFVSAIHSDDDLLHYGLPLASGHRALRYYQAAQMYFGGGDWNAHEVKHALRDAGFRIQDAGSFLEFASGYGRLTRYFVQMLDPSKITVADIDPRAVDFLKRRLGVKGFYSASSADGLSHDGRYDLIVVVSLFSHLPNDSWGPWLRRLSGLLNPDGVLLFTTHNFNDADAEQFESQAEGFLYRDVNETRGRLAGAQYGAAFVSEDYVGRVVAENFPGKLVKFAPHGLLMAQDVYVLQRAGDLGDRLPHEAHETASPPS